MPENTLLATNRPEFALTSFLSTLGSGTSLGSCKAKHQGFGDVDPAGS